MSELNILIILLKKALKKAKAVYLAKCISS